MREVFEFRVREELAAQFLSPQTGRRLGLGIARVIKAPRGSPLFDEIGRLDSMCRAGGRGGFFTKASMLAPDSLAEFLIRSEETTKVSWGHGLSEHAR